MNDVVLLALRRVTIGTINRMRVETGESDFREEAGSLYFMANEVAQRADISPSEALDVLTELRKMRAVTCLAGFSGKSHERVWQLKDIKSVLSRFRSNFS